MKAIKLLLILGIGVQMISCTSKPGVYFGEKQKALPDSARVKAMISVSQNETREKLSAVLFAVPNERYRFELSGTFGISAASILWKRDGWKIVFSQEERYMEGEGECVFIPVYGGVDIHKFAALFFGQRANSLSCDDSDNPNLFLEYADNSAVAFFGTDSLKLEIKSIEPKAEWKSGVWNMNIPDKYVKMSF